MAIYKDVEPLELFCYESDSEDFDKGVNFVLEKLDALPTADVVEVVRCGKCKHGEVSIISKTKDGEETIACYCKAKNRVTDLEYYCACGERRRGNDV